MKPKINRRVIRWLNNKIDDLMSEADSIDNEIAYLENAKMQFRKTNTLPRRVRTAYNRAKKR